MPYKPGDNLYASFVTQDGTGAAINADSLPTATLRRNGTNSGTTVTVTNNTTGDYTASATLPTTWAGGDKIELLIAATVKGIAGKSLFALGALDRFTQDATRALLATANTVWFVTASGGSDSSDGRSWDTAFATIAKAITVATAGDVIQLSPGTFALSNAVVILPDRVSLFGAGARRTTITSTAVLTSLGCIVKPGSNSVVGRLGISCVGSSVYQACFGFNTAASTPQTSATNWVLEDAYLEGDTDGIYLADTSSTPAQSRGTVRNCTARTKYDSFSILTTPGTTWDLSVDLVGFIDFRAIGPSVAGSSAGTSRAVNVSTGTVRLFGGYYEAGGSSTENNALALRDGSAGSSAARLECYNSVLVSSGTNNLDAYNGGGTLVIGGAQYDPTKTSGAITLRAVPINRAGQIDAVALPAITLASAQNYNNTGQTTPLPSAAAFAGANSITLQFKDAGGAAVAGVVFTIVGLGSAAADVMGSKTVGLAAGTYTVKALPAAGTLFADTSITVTAVATITITGTASVITPAPSAGQTTAYLTTRTGQGTALSGITLTFQLIDPQAATDSFDQTTFTAISDASGLLQVPLLKATKYQARAAGGPWVSFTTGSSSSYALPEVLGTYGP